MGVSENVAVWISAVMIDLVYDAQIYRSEFSSVNIEKCLSSEVLMQ